jgi:hypothetical protein
VTAGGDATASPVLAMAVLVPQVGEHRTEPAATGPVFPTALPGRVPAPALPDPLQAIAEALPVAVALEGDAIELSCGDAEGADELLETLYVFGGWPDVDDCIAQVERALVLLARDLYPEGQSGGMPVVGDGAIVVPPATLDAPSAGVPGPVVRHRAPPVDARSFIARLADAAEVEGSRPLIASALRDVNPMLSLFAYDLPRAWVPTAAGGDASLAARAFARVVLDLAAARRALVSRVVGAMRDIEREATRRLMTLLVDAGSAIVRETTRYFPVQREGARAALANLDSMRLRTVRGDVDPTLTEDPARLKAALVALHPLAKKVVALVKDAGMASTSTPKKSLGDLLALARAALAHALARETPGLPVLARFTAREIRDAKDQGPIKLGETTFSILQRAWIANGRMQQRVREFRGMAAVQPAERRPDLALAAVTGPAERRASIWAFRDWVARGADAVAGGSDDVARRACEDALAAVGGADGGVSPMQQAAGEMIAMGAAAKFATRLVPVVNVALAAWHIASAIDVYERQYDEFYCTLDLRDALVEAPPSAIGLAVDVGTEAVFAVV